METKAKGAYGALLALSGLCAAAAVATLMPAQGAPWTNIIGYKSVCSFAPISTAVCALLAEASCVTRARFFGPRRGEKRSWLVPILVAAVLLAVIALAIPGYSRALSDAGSGASAVLGR